MIIVILLAFIVWLFLALYCFYLLKIYRSKKAEIRQNSTISKADKPIAEKLQYELTVEDKLLGFSVKSFITLTTNALLVIITTIGVYTSAQSFREQSVLNREQNILEYKKERAYVNLQKFEDIVFPNGNHKLVFQISNSGGTPAMKTVASVFYSEDVTDETKKKEFLRYFALTGLTISPGGSWAYNFDVRKELLINYAQDSAILFDVNYNDYLGASKISRTLVVFRDNKFEVLGNEMD